MPSIHNHKGWTILVFDLALDSEKNWSFSCCPKSGEALNPGELYANSELALQAAIAFIERLLVRCQMADLLDSWLELGQISAEEHRQANELLSKLATLLSPP